MCAKVSVLRAGRGGPPASGEPWAAHMSTPAWRRCPARPDAIPSVVPAIYTGRPAVWAFSSRQSPWEACCLPPPDREELGGPAGGYAARSTAPSNPRRKGVAHTRRRWMSRPVPLQVLRADLDVVVVRPCPSHSCRRAGEMPRQRTWTALRPRRGKPEPFSPPSERRLVPGSPAELETPRASRFVGRWRSVKSPCPRAGQGVGPSS